MGFNFYYCVILSFVFLQVSAAQMSDEIRPMQTINPKLNDRLIEAVVAKDLSAIDNLLGASEIPDVNGVGLGNQAPLLFAVEGGKVEIASRLLDAGARVNQVNKGNTALMSAAARGNTQMVKMLLQRGADPYLYAAAYGGHTFFDLIVGNSRLEAVWTDFTRQQLQPQNVVFENQEKLDNALVAAFPVGNHTGDFGAIEKLIAHGAHVNAKNSLGTTALMVAAQQGHEDLVKELLRRQAAVNEINIAGRRALDLAAQKGHKEIVTLLLRSGANPLFKGRLGKIARNYAEEQRDATISDERRELYRSIVEMLENAEFKYLVRAAESS